MNKLIKSLIIGISVSIFIFILTGIVTSLLPNPWFARMVNSTDWDYLVLILTSLLIGAYMGLSVYKKNTENKCDYLATSGSFLGFFSLACPICNTFSISLFGASVLMIYFNPYRPFLGLLSIGLLGSVVIFKLKYNKEVD